MPNPGQPPVGIITTFSLDMIKVNGGPDVFIRAFLKCMADPTNWWLHRCRNRPQYDVPYVYITIGGKLLYRVQYAGHETGPAVIYKGKHEHTINWPRILLVGPLVEAPYEIPMKGFRGFHYTDKELF